MGTLDPAEYNVPVPEVVIGQGLAVHPLADHELEQGLSPATAGRQDD